ncbi:DUF3967 domain-containing protein [Bacillus sp. ISL-55]|uniref:DUF3967 domain-containing protein n=1 Tax=Bacillus sp. ISL-55 TaxID=2819134 RepID=UPI001BE7A64C|nr:DUF3967 domain-containing protein [Bacillus sp. ISL-55]MBT2695428.1 MerR family transcriptional regulator [Bacillus sp. ISL-55]
MSNETQQSQAVYSSNDVAVTLQIQESTLRKYCLILEKNGHEFLKNEHGHRAFFDHDIIVLKKFKELKSGSDMTLEQASKAVIAWKNGNSITELDTQESSYVARYSDLLEEFKLFKQQQMEFNKELLSELKKQQDYINHHLEERDQKLMLSLKESLEAKQQLALEESKRKSWWKFWK